MPIMRPEHQSAMRNAQKILSEVGVEGARRPIETSEEEATPVVAALNRVGLSLDEIVEELAMKVRSSNEGISSRAVDTVLKMHGALKEAAVGTSAPSFTINIVDGKTSSQAPSANLNIPEGVNPIFVPRQLLQQMQKIEDSKSSN